MANPVDIFLQILRNTTLEGSVKQGTVLSVDKDNNVVSVEIEEMQYDNIPIKVLIDSASDISYPLVGTTVYVATLENNPQFRFLLSTQDIDSIIRSGLSIIDESSENRNIDITEDFNISSKNINISVTQNLEINANQTIFNDGNNGGMLLLNNTVQKLNNLENQVNNIVSILTGITVVIGPGGGTVPFAPFFSSITPLVPTQASEVENNKITQ